MIKNYNSYELSKKTNEYSEYSSLFQFSKYYLFQTNNIIVCLESITEKYYVKNKVSSKIYSISKKDIGEILNKTNKMLSNVIFEKFIDSEFNVNKTINLVNK